MIKHLTAYSQETGRAGDAPTDVGRERADELRQRRADLAQGAERDLHRAVRRRRRGRRAGLFMCSFPAINGTYACEDAYVMNKMRAEYGFKGAIGPDFPNAQHSVAAALTAGCDDCSSDVRRHHAAGRGRRPARVRAGTLDRMIYARSSLVPHRPHRQPAGGRARTPLTCARPPMTRSPEDVATDGAVLLKNAGGAGCRWRSARGSIAVIGAERVGGADHDLGGRPTCRRSPGAWSRRSRASRTARRRARRSTTRRARPRSASSPTRPSCRACTCLLGDLLRHAGLDRSGRALADRDRRQPQRRHPEPEPSRPARATATAARSRSTAGRSATRGTFTRPDSGTYVFSLGDGGAAQASPSTAS